MNIIWTKDNCFYCFKAKELLDSLAIHYEERNINKNYTKADMLEAVPTAKTVPQIFIGGTYIGGYTDLVQFTEK